MIHELTHEQRQILEWCTALGKNHPADPMHRFKSYLGYRVGPYWTEGQCSYLFGEERDAMAFQEECKSQGIRAVYYSPGFGHAIRTYE